MMTWKSHSGYMDNSAKSLESTSTADINKRVAFPVGPIPIGDDVGRRRRAGPMRGSAAYRAVGSDSDACHPQLWDGQNQPLRSETRRFALCINGGAEQMNPFEGARTDHSAIMHRDMSIITLRSITHPGAHQIPFLRHFYSQSTSVWD